MNCEAKTKSGKPCRAPATGGTGRCLMHSGRAAELGRKGGHRRTAYRPDGLEEIAAPKTGGDLRNLLAQSIVEVRSGKLDPRIANCINYLGTGFLNALERSDLEKRVGRLEDSVAASKKD